LQISIYNQCDFSLYSQLRQILNLAIITSLTRPIKSSAVYTWEKSVWQVEHRRNESPFVEGFRQFQISVYSCLHLSLITGSDFFKLSPLLAFGMPPLIFRHMLLDHQSVCKEHGHTIIIKCTKDKGSVLRSVIYHKKQKYFLAIFLQLVGVELTYEGVERNLGFKNRRNYAKIVVVNRSVLFQWVCTI
jgi:hypothetical protein